MSSRAMTASVYSLIGKGDFFSSCFSYLLWYNTSKLRGFKKQLFCILGIEWTITLHGVDDEKVQSGPIRIAGKVVMGVGCEHS